MKILYSRLRNRANRRDKRFYVGDKLDSIWKEVVVTYFDTLSQDCVEGLRKKWTLSVEDFRVKVRSGTLIKRSRGSDQCIAVFWLFHDAVSTTEL